MLQVEQRGDGLIFTVMVREKTPLSSIYTDTPLLKAVTMLYLFSHGSDTANIQTRELRQGLGTYNGIINRQD